MGDTGSRPPQLRPGRALAHTLGASGSGSPHRSDGRSPQTPRGARLTGLDGGPGTTPPFPGSPTFLLLLSGLPALLFALITWQIAVHGPLARADERLSGDLVHRDGFSDFLADLGNVTVAVPVLAVILVYVALRTRRAGTDHWWVPSVAAGVLMALVPALIVPLKELIGRPGPPIMGPGTGYYPSGHTATASIAYGGAVLVLWPWLRGTRLRAPAVLVALALNLGVAVGLVRSGYHWPLDVVASWCLCAMLLLSLRLFLGRSGRRG
ncbi:phosphatase PAP2 family protein [Streptomyces spongiae]|uniref:phosphatase PAP2 family protein n=1 Tax=Streptomyces spongiae TaxID=565072 RepID=UPI002AD3CEA5|nr:phosphatase PAP2 family protein [Streptomyces spongiae]